jgi:hypothetical protein
VVGLALMQRIGQGMYSQLLHTMCGQSCSALPGAAGAAPLTCAFTWPGAWKMPLCSLQAATTSSSSSTWRPHTVAVYSNPQIVQFLCPYRGSALSLTRHPHATLPQLCCGAHHNMHPGVNFSERLRSVADGQRSSNKSREVPSHLQISLSRCSCAGVSRLPSRSAAMLVLGQRLPGL